MIRLHLLGFTPDLKGLVFSGRRGGKSGTYWVPVDSAFAKAMLQLDEAREAELEEAVAERERVKAEKQAEKAERAAARTRKPAADDTLDFALDLLGDEGDDDEEPTVMDTQDLPMPPEPPKINSKLSPREIQQMLREGRTVSDVASKAEVDEAWVERFLGPIVEEQTGVIQAVQSAIQRRARLGASGLPIGRAVVRNLEERKATDATFAELTDGWDARRMRSKTWRVRLRFTHRGKRRTAEWELRRDANEVSPKNKLATELGWCAPLPGAPEPEPEPVVDARDDVTDEVTPAKPAPRKRPAARKRGAARKRQPAKRKPKKTAVRSRGSGAKKTSRPAAKRKAAPKKKTSSRAKPARTPSKRPKSGGGRRR